MSESPTIWELDVLIQSARAAEEDDRIVEGPLYERLADALELLRDEVDELRGRARLVQGPDRAPDDLRDLTEDEQAMASAHARRLFNDAGFIAAVKSAKEHIMKEICNTRPDEADVREALYHEQRALSRLWSRLDSMSQERKPSLAYRSIA